MSDADAPNRPPGEGDFDPEVVIAQLAKIIDAVHAADGRTERLMAWNAVNAVGFPAAIGLAAFLMPDAVEAQFVRAEAAPGMPRQVGMVRSKVRDIADRLERESRAKSDQVLDGMEVAQPREFLFGTPGLTLRVPPGWIVDRTGVYRLVRLEGGGWDRRMVAIRPIGVTGMLRDIDTQAYHAHVEWVPLSRGDMGWRSVVVAAATTQDARAMIALRDQGAPVSLSGVRHLARFLDELEAANHDRLPLASSTTRMGWVGASGSGANLRGFILGRRLLAPDGTVTEPDAPPSAWGENYVHLTVDDGARQAADAFVPAGTIEQWRDAISKILHLPHVMLAIYASLAAPILGILPNAPNMIVDWSGDTSHGKTTTLRVGASCWGRPDERGGIIQSWDASAAGVDTLAELSMHLPMFMDDTKRATTRGRKEDVASMVYQIAQGKGRVRGKPDGMRAVKTWRLILLSTGEAPVTSFTQDAGARARVLSLRGSPFGDGDQSKLVHALTLQLLDNFGHAGPTALRALMANRDKWPAIREVYETDVNEYTARFEGDPVGARAAHFLALLKLGRMLAHAPRWGVALPATPEGRDPLRLAEESARAGVADTDQPAQAARSVYAWAVAHETEFWGRGPRSRTPHEGWAGAWSDAWNWTTLSFSPHRLDQILAEHGYEPRAIVESWNQRNWLIPDGRHLTSKVTVNRERLRHYVILREALTDEPPVPPPPPPRAPDPYPEPGSYEPPDPDAEDSQPDWGGRDWR